MELFCEAQSAVWKHLMQTPSKQHGHFSQSILGEIYKHIFMEYLLDVCLYGYNQLLRH